MRLEMDVIDAFTDRLFSGNSAAVIITASWLDTALMQSIARENNLSETAFVVPLTTGAYAIRWFSPLAEIDFCGHATLAAAFVLFERNPDQLSLSMRAEAVGEMRIQQLGRGYMQMDFPNRAPQVIETIPPALMDGLSLPPVEVLRNQQAYFAVYRDEQAVRDLNYRSEVLKTLAPYDVVATAPGQQYDFVSRYEMLGYLNGHQRHNRISNSKIKNRKSLSLAVI